MNSKGRPLLGKERKQRYQVALEPKVAEMLRRYSGNNLSGGISLMAAKLPRR
jgi:hypothetical protein